VLLVGERMATTMFKQLYLRKTFPLDPAIFPAREIRETITFDRMYVDLKNTTASLDNVEISIDGNDFITLSYLVNGIEIGELQRVGNVIREVIIPKPHLVRIKWNSSEDGKVVVLLFGREAMIRIAPPSSMILVSDAVGLAKDSTFKGLLKASLLNVSISANTNILSSSITPSLATSTSPSIFRIYVAFDTIGVLSIVRTKGSITVVEQLNGGNALNANASYMFDIPVEYEESINLQYSVNTTLLVLKVIEIAGVIG